MFHSELPIDLDFTMLGLVAYVLAARCVLILPENKGRTFLFMILNLSGVSLIYARQNLAIGRGLLSTGIGLLLYVLSVIALYVLTSRLVFGRMWWLAATAPIAWLFLARHIPIQLYLRQEVGLAYMALRLSQLAAIVRNKVVPPPSFSEYLSFAFFLPTFMVGPISSYSTFKKSYSEADAYVTPPGRCAMRVLVGLAKYIFFGNIFNHLSYSGLILDGHLHPPVDLIVSAFAYYFYLYCNFSGFCDVAVGVAGLLGIKVSENFDEPFTARNIREFWNRWHMTLYAFMKDMVFTPLSKSLVALVPAAFAEHAVGAVIVVVFILIGIWHGASMHYILFGAVHALGVLCNYYYGLVLKKILTREQMRRYNESPSVKLFATVVTLVFVAASFFVFANDFPDMERIIRSIGF